MADFLESLSQGLRSAAGILNPDIQKMTFAADERDKNLQIQRQQFLFQTIAKQVETGAIKPEEGQTALKQFGINAPVGMMGPSAETQAKQTALKRDYDFRQGIEKLGAEATIDQIASEAMKHGKPEIAFGMYKVSEEKATRLQVAADNNATRLLTIQQQMNDKNLSREQQAALARMHDATLRQGQLIQQQNYLVQQELRRLQIAASGDKEAQRREEVLDRNVTSFANELQQQKIPALSSSITQANNLLRKYENKPDIPGVGFAEGSPKLPNAFRSEEANNVRSAIQAVTNDLLNLYSGLAVTLPESERRELEQMRGGDFTEVDFKNAWPRTVQRYNAVLGNMTASQKPEALKRYQERPGAMDLKPVMPAFGGSGWSIKEKTK
jgi:hypothetical protein